MTLADSAHDPDPVESTTFPPDYYERVKKVHQEGGFGSTGYRYPFSKEETSRLVLRTHTTSVSTAMLYEIANQPGGFKPAKLFSIDRVFRNEAVDATHLAEFHQVEGVIADHNLTLADLIGRSNCLHRWERLISFFLSRSRLHGDLLRQDGHHRPPLQACLQPLQIGRAHV